MSDIYQIVSPEGKRMAVWSKRDLEYMELKGWKLFKHPDHVAEVATNVAEVATPKKRGRPKGK